MADFEKCKTSKHTIKYAVRDGTTRSNYLFFTTFCNITIRFTICAWNRYILAVELVIIAGHNISPMILVEV